LNEELVDRLRLVRTNGIGPVTFRQLIRRFGNAGAAVDAVTELARQGGGEAPRLFERGETEREIVRIEKLGARYLVLGQGLYPRLLAELEDAPPLLVAKGDLNLLDRMAVAIVGARNASAAACRFARGLAHNLGQQDLVVVSGLARGIDSAAHDGALATGIGVIAGGIDVFYPPENEQRRQRRRQCRGTGRGAARTIAGSSRRDHSPLRRLVGRSAVGAARAGPRRQSRSPCGRQGHFADRLTLGIRGPHLYAYA
jgi:DNA processing protein